MTDQDNDEKGFNDDELKDIMDEIESLEQEFTDDEPEGSGKEMSAPLSEKVEEKVDDILDNESSKPSVKPVKNNVSQLPKKSSTPVSAHSKMAFKLEGEMSVELNFEVGGKQLSLCVTEKDGVVIELEDGAKFCLPVSHKAA